MLYPIADELCCDLDAVCAEVIRGLREGHKMMVERCQTPPASFIVTHYPDKLPVKGFRSHQNVGQYTGA